MLLLTTKYICTNQEPLMSKELQKTIMIRSKQRNKYLEVKLFARCSLLVTFLLLARHYLLVARYFLFVAHYFLLVSPYLLLVALSFLLSVCYLLPVAHDVLLAARYFFIQNTANRNYSELQRNSLTITKLQNIFSLQISEILVSFSG